MRLQPRRVFMTVLESMRSTIVLAAVSGLVLAPVTCQAASLVGRAVLPADTFSVGPTSGQFITAANGRVPPFARRQPVQGFSAVLKSDDGGYLALCDNGFGAKANSADFLLSVYRLTPDFATRSRGTGTVGATLQFNLRDPDRKVSFPIVADGDTYPGSAIPVDPAILAGRLLTGADFDIESFRQVSDGSFWFGDEFGPFLIHTDRTGRVLEAPIPLPGVRSPDNPLPGPAANLPRSKGFEGMALSPDGRFLYPLLEGPLTTEADQRRLMISEFDTHRRAYTGRRWFYRLEASSATGQSIGDMTAVNKREFLVIERDNFEGAAAQFKKIFLVDLTKVDRDGFLVKREVADLMNLADPDDIARTGTGVFTFPFTTIESVIPIDAQTLGVLNDNNYPFSAGRRPGQPDDNEFILIRLDSPLQVDSNIAPEKAAGDHGEHD